MSKALRVDRGAPIAWLVAVLPVLFLVACGQDPLPRGGAAERTDDVRTTDDGTISPTVLIDTAAAPMPFDRRLLGTNVPAWIGPDRLADEAFHAVTRESGVELLRMPGGSWSNSYDFAGCEVSDPDRCYFVGTARPTDFIDFMQALELPGIWTLPADATAQHAAAAVAFFNGEIGDERVIGVDREGVDWATVGFWAGLRAAGGNDEPAPIRLWEVGNEVYGGRPEVGGPECADFGWEDVWTCDGTEYVLGDDEHDGYLSLRSAMLDVDPTVEVGAVGVGDPRAWSNWGNEVIDGAGEQLDMYVVHAYGFDSSPAGESAIRRPAELWPGIVDGVRERLDADVPIAVTEYNLVAFGAGDTERTMTQAMNGLYVADTIGQLATRGVRIANHWDLATGNSSPEGTGYEMIGVDNSTTNPQFEAIAMWSRVGTGLMQTTTNDDDIRAYATRHDDGRLTLILLNLADRPISTTVATVLDESFAAAELFSVWTDDLTATEMVRESTTLPPSDAVLPVVLPPWSINALEMDGS